MPSNTKTELQELILRCRTERGLSLPKMAKAVGLSPAGLWKIENGKVKPHATTEGRLIAFLRKHGYFTKLEAA